MQRELLARVFQKMRRIAMGFQCGIAGVLLVNKEAAGIAAMAMHDVHQASWLFARFGCQAMEDLDGFFFVARFCHPDYGKNNHF